MTLLWFALLVLTPLLGLVALLFSVLGLVEFRQQRSYRSHAWPGTPGAVLSAEVEENTSISVGGLGGSVSYDPKITYEYTVEGVTYRGNKISLGAEPESQGVRFFPDDQKAASAIVARYPPGLAVTVYFCPADPSLAILEPRPVKLDLSCLVVAGICFVVWLLALAAFVAFFYSSR
jgi:hypothetical protein